MNKCYLHLNVPPLSLARALCTHRERRTIARAHTHTHRHDQTLTLAHTHIHTYTHNHSRAHEHARAHTQIPSQTERETHTCQPPGRSTDRGVDSKGLAETVTPRPRGRPLPRKRVGCTGRNQILRRSLHRHSMAWSPGDREAPLVPSSGYRTRLCHPSTRMLREQGRHVIYRHSGCREAAVIYRRPPM